MTKRQAVNKLSAKGVVKRILSYLLVASPVIYYLDILPLVGSLRGDPYPCCMMPLVIGREQIAISRSYFETVMSVSNFAMLILAIAALAFVVYFLLEKRFTLWFGLFLLFSAVIYDTLLLVFGRFTPRQYWMDYGLAYNFYNLEVLMRELLFLHLPIILVSLILASTISLIARHFTKSRKKTPKKKSGSN